MISIHVNDTAFSKYVWDMYDDCLGEMVYVVTIFIMHFYRSRGDTFWIYSSDKLLPYQPSGAFLQVL